MIIGKAIESDIPSICRIYDDIHTAEESGSIFVGWRRGIYPTDKTVLDSFCRGDLFVEKDENGVIVASAIINQIQVPDYSKGKWVCDAKDEEVMVLHTLAVSPSFFAHGYGKAFVNFYENYAAEHGCRYLRMDTNAGNSRARAMYKKLGYSETGIIPTVFNGIEGVSLVLLEKAL